MELSFEPRHITPQVSGFHVRDTLEKAAKYKDCAVIGNVMARLIMSKQGYDFLDFEKIFRELQSPIYLIAGPRSKLLPDQDATCFKTHTLSKYWLWICVEGESVALKTMLSFGSLSYDDNFAKLSDTGFITQKN